MLRWIRLACATWRVWRARARYEELRQLRLVLPHAQDVMIAEAHALADMHAAILHWEGVRHG